MRPTDQFEDRLRAALEAQSREVRVSADAWGHNQRRLAAASGRGRRVLTVAAVALTVATLVGGIALLGGRGPGGAPASGTGDSFSTENLLGPAVEAESLTIDGQQTVHTIALSDMTGEGPNLCDQYEQVVSDGGDASNSNSSSGSGGCTTRDPAADDEEVAFDWLMGTEGSGDIRGVTAGVDGRVSTVRIWMNDGDMVPATLHPTGWDDTRMFALTTQPPDAPAAQRLVAYGRDGNVLQAVDLPERLGDEWLTARSFCQGGEQARWPLAGSGGTEDVMISFGPTDALVAGSAVTTPACVERLSAEPIAGLTGFGDLLVAVIAPEVKAYRVEQAPPGLQADMYFVDGTPWQVLVATVPPQSTFGEAQLVVVDDTERELDRELLSRPASP